MSVNGVSGIQHLDNGRVILDHLAKQFNSESNDVTFEIGSEKIGVHRLILASQSSVFNAMLTGKNWKESNDDIVPITEPPDCEAVFQDFLKYFYTGELTLTCTNVCSVHMFADKYDVPTLKAGCEKFFVDVLSGKHGDAFLSAMEWLHYIEEFLPAILTACYEAICNNFSGMLRNDIHLKKLTLEQFKTILSSGDDIIVQSEFFVYGVVEKWLKLTFAKLSSPKVATALSTLLPLIRFYNMDSDQLDMVMKSELGQIYGQKALKDHMYEAYKVQAERYDFSMNAVKKRRRLDSEKTKGVCSCSGETCKHMHPRLYLDKQFGLERNVANSKAVESVKLEPVDLDNLQKYTQRIIHQVHREAFVPSAMAFGSCEDTMDYLSNNGGEWKVRTERKEGPWTKNETVRLAFEKYTLVPSKADIGRSFIVVLHMRTTGADGPPRMYTKKYSGFVTKDERGNSEPIALYSPIRTKRDWGTKSNVKYQAAVYLQKR